MKLPVVTRDQWFLIAIIILVIAIAILIIFPVRNSSAYRKSIKSLTEQRDSLKASIYNQEQLISEQARVVKLAEMKLDTVNFVNSILKQKIKKYEKTYLDVRNMSTDDGILFLTKYLSEEAPN